jgi:DNA end-binding protein Ku
MARSMWRGAIQFGLVTIPVKLYLATETRAGLAFNMLHKECLNRVQMKTACPIHGDISRGDTLRGYEWSKGQYVIIDEGDFEAVPLKTVRAIEIERFVPVDRGDFGSTFVKQAYYVEPEAIGRKAFFLLKSVLADSSLQAICKIVLKDREVLAALDPYSTTMLLSTLYWPDEVRSVADLDIPDEQFEFKPAEKAMAQQLVQAMTGEFDPAEYRDEYREALMSVIQAKIDGQPIEASEPMVETRGLTDLMAVLEASVAAARSGRAAASQAPAEASDTADEPTSVAAVRRARAAGGSKSASVSSKTGKASSTAARSAPSPKAAPDEADAVEVAAAPKAERKRKSA